MLLTGRPCCNTILIIKSGATTTDKSANDAASDFSGSDHSPRIFYSLASRLSSLSLTRRLLNPGEKEISRTGAELIAILQNFPRKKVQPFRRPHPPPLLPRKKRKKVLNNTDFLRCNSCRPDTPTPLVGNEAGSRIVFSNNRSKSLASRESNRD